MLLCKNIFQCLSKVKTKTVDVVPSLTYIRSILGMDLLMASMNRMNNCKKAKNVSMFIRAPDYCVKTDMLGFTLRCRYIVG